jgi:hypothetical protein
VTRLVALAAALLTLAGCGARGGKVYEVGEAAHEGGLGVEVGGVTLGKVRGKSFGSPAVTPADYLAVSVRLSNLTTDRKWDYRSWGAVGLMSKEEDLPRLTDDAGNSYKVAAGLSFDAEGHVPAASIRPGESAGDVLLFEPPLPGKTLTLTLPLRAVEQFQPGGATVTFRIPPDAIRRP